MPPGQVTWPGDAVAGTLSGVGICRQSDTIRPRDGARCTTRDEG